jgi:hypothetical protein
VSKTWHFLLSIRGHDPPSLITPPPFPLLPPEKESVIGCLRKDGKRINAHVVITPRRDAAGQPVGFLLISKDISNELRFSEETRKTKLFDSAILGKAQEAVGSINNVLESSK